MNAEQIYNELKNIVYPIHAHSDQLLAIANWIKSEFEYKGDDTKRVINKTNISISICSICKVNEPVKGFTVCLRCMESSVK